MWTYKQSTGQFIASDGSILTVGYSGGGIDSANLAAASGKNNPSMEDAIDIGPIPRGYYTIGAPVNTITHGSYVMPLDPDVDNTMYGRDEFKIHGDSLVNPGWASEGCIILWKPYRITIWESGDHRLEVIS